MARLTTFSRLLLTILIVLGIFFGIKYFLGNTGLLEKKVTVVNDLERADESTNAILSSAPKNYETAGIGQLPLPSDADFSPTGSTPRMTYLGMGWNAQTPIAYANGGAVTKQGSLIAKRNLSLNFIRQDDYGKMQEALVKFAADYQKNPRTPAVFCGIMGDNMASFKVGLDQKLKEVDPSLEVKGFYICGYSYGEDKFIGPISWKRDPQKARGGVCSVVLKDGDHNIAIKWASDNDVPVNPDPTVYDPGRLNFIGVSTFVEAADRFVANQTVELPEVKDGARTGKTAKVKIDATSTWSPEDEKTFKSGRDVVTLLSTRENVKQMPCLMLGVNKYLSENQDAVKRLIAALAESGDQIKTFDAALRYGARMNGEVFGEEVDWYELYKGKEFETNSGRTVSVGGSRSCNLADNADDLGIAPNSSNSYQSVYTLFAGYMSKLYPEDLPAFPPAAQALDLTALRSVYAGADKTKLAAGFETKVQSGDMTDVYGRRNYNIEFQTGKASFSPGSERVLEEIYNSLNTTNLRMTIRGHTDNTGAYEANMALSQARADAVRTWIQKRSKYAIQPARFAQVMGFGPDKPVASNDTPDGKAKNRRVEIVFGE
jgi:OmpA-OmpF porin, OOP family